MYPMSFFAITRRLPGPQEHHFALLVWGSTVSEHPSSGVCSESSWSISATLSVPLLSQTASSPTVVIPHFAEKELWLRDIKKPAKEQMKTEQVCLTSNILPLPEAAPRSNTICCLKHFAAYGALWHLRSYFRIAQTQQ